MSPRRYNHLVSLGFSIDSDVPFEQLLNAEILAALAERMAELIRTGHVREAIENMHDTEDRRDDSSCPKCQQASDRIGDRANGTIVFYCANCDIEYDET